MAFSGLSTYDQFTASGGSLIEEDVSPLIYELAPAETPLLDWLGDSPYAATNILHEFVEEELRPNYIIASSAINSATAATGITINGFGNQLTVGTLLENESASPEVMQITSIPGANSILVSRAFGGGAVGSLVAGGQLFVRAPLALEGQDATGDLTRPRVRNQTYCKLFQVPITVSLTQAAVKGIGIEDEYNHQKEQRIKEVLRDLEKEVIRGVASGNSIGSETLYRSFNGIKARVTTINSTVVGSSFNANPHLYVGNVWQQAFNNGLRQTDTVALVAGAQFFSDLSNLNDTKVLADPASQVFQRRVRRYVGPYGEATLILSPWMPSSALVGVVRERVKVVPLRNRTFRHIPLAMTGSAMKGMVEGEYTAEVAHQKTMFQLHT